jgi:hypothetical protein
MFLNYQIFARRHSKAGDSVHLAVSRFEFEEGGRGCVLSV